VKELEELTNPGIMQCAAHDGFVNINIAVPDFQVECAFRVGTDPGFIMYGSTLTAEVGQRY